MIWTGWTTRLSKSVKALIRNRHFWIILAMLVLCTIHHYGAAIGLSISLPFDGFSSLTRHAVDRVLFLAPVIYAGYVFGATAGLAMTFAVLLLMLPRALLISSTPTDALVEIAAVVLMGALANLWLRARTRQMEVAARYSELFRSAPDAIWVHDLKGNILSVNKAAEMLTGLNTEDLCGMNVKELVSRESFEVAKNMQQRLLGGEVIPQPYEQHLTRRDGTEAILRVTSSLIYNNRRPQAFQNVARDITDEEMRQENLQFYVGHITKAYEEERLRIAGELHDSTAQSLITVLQQLENFLYDQPNLPVHKVREIWSIREHIKDILQELRCLSRDLRPSILDDVGLVAALRWTVRELETEYGIQSSLQVCGAERRFSKEVELNFFRIVQEALRNIGKHSYASTAEVVIEFEDRKTIVIIRDNGVGFGAPKEISALSRNGKLGLVGMQERARLLDGVLEIKSEPGKGTSVIVEAPI
jgi:two-component system sensor histidine kinase DegS